MAPFHSLSEPSASLHQGLRRALRLPGTCSLSSRAPGRRPTSSHRHPPGRLSGLLRSLCPVLSERPVPLTVTTVARVTPSVEAPQGLAAGDAAAVSRRVPPAAAQLAGSQHFPEGQRTQSFSRNDLESKWRVPSQRGHRKSRHPHDGVSCHSRLGCRAGQQPRVSTHLTTSLCLSVARTSRSVKSHVWCFTSPRSPRSGNCFLSRKGERRGQVPRQSAAKCETKTGLPSQRPSALPDGLGVHHDHSRGCRRGHASAEGAPRLCSWAPLHGESRELALQGGWKCSTVQMPEASSDAQHVGADGSVPPHVSSMVRAAWTQRGRRDTCPEMQGLALWGITGGHLQRQV